MVIKADMQILSHPLKGEGVMVGVLVLGLPGCGKPPQDSCQHESCTSVHRTSLVLVNNSSDRDRVGWEAVQGDHRIVE